MNTDLDETESNIIMKSNMQQQIDEKFMNALRELLEGYKTTLTTDNSEISKGLGINRLAVTKFMEKEYDYLPGLSPGRIYQLWETLSDVENVEHKRPTKQLKDRVGKSTEDIRKNAQLERKKLRDNGPDELLITAGFQPHRMKMVPVSAQQHSQLNFISLLYKDRPISQELFFQITQQEIDRRERAVDKLNSKEGDFSDEDLSKTPLLKELLENPWMSKKIKQQIEEKYKKAVRSVKST